MAGEQTGAFSKFAHIFANRKASVYYRPFREVSRGYKTARPSWTNEGSKRVVQHKDVPFGWGSEQLSLIFLIKPLKTEILAYEWWIGR